MNHRSKPEDAFAAAIECLYERLLGLETAPHVDPALVDLLRSLADVTRCDLVYLELRQRDDYWLGHATYALPPGVLRARVRRDLVQRAIVERRMVTELIPAAMQRWRPAAHALCTPIGSSVPIGALYAESPEGFGVIERGRFERVAAHLARVLPTVLQQQRSLPEEIRDLKQRRIREAMQRHGDNIAEVARVLGVSRTLLYRAMGGDVASRDTDAGQLSSDATDPPDMERSETENASDLDRTRRKRIASTERA